MKRKTERPRLKELPGWEAACQKALRAKQRMPAGHYLPYIGPGVLRTLGNFIAPASIDRVTVRLILCMGLGVKGFQDGKQIEAELPVPNVIDFRKARARLCGEPMEFDKDEPATWWSSHLGAPPTVWRALEAHRTVKDDDDGGVEEQSQTVS